MKNKYFSDKTVYKIVALLLTIVLWFYVAQTQNPTEDELYEVPIDYVNISSGLALSEKLESVSVRVSASSTVLEGVSMHDIVATVDMSAAHSGQNILPVNISLPPQVQLISVNPLDVVVEVENKVEVQFVVDAVVTATPQNSYSLLDPVLFPNEVLITGAANVIDSVEKVYVNIQGNDISSSVSASLPIIVEDADGNRLNDLVNLSTKNIDVMLPVISDMPTKLMPIQADLVGEVAEGYAVSRVIISPSIANVYGNQVQLDKVDYVYTESIDISGAADDISTQVKLVTADGLRVDNTTGVDVYVQIEKQATRVFKNVPVNLLNTGNRKYKLSANYVSVTVTGAQSVIDALSQNMISVECDVAGITSGSSTVNLNATVSGSAYITAITPTKVTVTVER